MITLHRATDVSSSADTPPGAEAPAPRAPGADIELSGLGDAPRRPWERPALVALLIGTAVLYLWGLGASGWANSFYSAAVQAGSESWKAFFFGSSDAANSITVDKPPMALWAMEISARVFGVNAWSILVPQALEGVATVGLLYATVKRWFGAGAGLLAGAVLALTPVAVLMFRFNNPDAMLMLLLVAAAYALVRALEGGSTRWLMAVGAFVGLAFLAKSLQAFLVLPAFGLAYLVAGPPKLGRRVVQLLAAAGAMVVAGGWWVAIVQLWPASSRPYIGGSQNNSLWNVIFGYNGFGRLTGNETGSVGGGGRGGAMWGETGWTRMFNTEFGSQAAWLIPTALVLLVALLGYSLTAKRTDRTRAAAIIWGGWLVVTGLTFSLGQGIIHPYYTVALGPAIGALVGIGGAWLWSRRSDPIARSLLVAATLAAGVTGYTLLDRVPTWHPELRPLVLVGAFLAAAGLLTLPWLGKARMGLAALVIVVGLAGPGTYSLATAATPHAGSLPTAGPLAGGGFGARGGPRGGRRMPGGVGGGGGARAGLPGNGQRPGGVARGGVALPGNGRFPGGATPGGAMRGGGGLLNAGTPSSALVKVLEADHESYTWIAATIGSNAASGYQLATGMPVMPIGGFNGSDPSPTLAQFQALVRAGRIHYFIGGGGFGVGMGITSNSSSAIASWVSQNFAAKTVGGVTVYDLATSS